MSKVFRIHDTGESFDGWKKSQDIGEDVIDKIIADESAGKHVPTAIPSPFARIDQVRSAFAKVAASNELDGVTHNHKLVSDALDIGQMFYGFEQNSQYLKIVQWDLNQGLNRLKNQGSAEHKHFAETIELFFNQDGAQYNFNRMSSIFILKYKNKVIGGTSPKSLFFAAPGADFINTDVWFGDDRMLDDKFRALYRRDKSFIKYLFAMSKSLGFADLFPEVQEYLNKTAERLEVDDYELYDVICNYNDTIYNTEYDDATLPASPGIVLNIINGIPLKKFKPEPFHSSFTIESPLCTEIENRPLVLPNGPFNIRGMKYAFGDWHDDIKVPEFDHTPINERILPGENIAYPYLCIGDFLTHDIVKLPYTTDREHYYVASDDKKVNYLLPLTQKFFEYYTAEALRNNKMLRMRNVGVDSVEVLLDIPVQSGVKITYQRIYNNTQDSDMFRIIDRKFTLGLFPFVKTNNDLTKYFIHLGEYETNELDIQLMQSSEKKVIDVESHQRSNLTNQRTLAYTYKGTFDVILLKGNSLSGAIIPILDPKSSGTTKFTFAIDFGTTNTHIGVKVDKQKGRDFSYENNSIEHMHFLRDRHAGDKSVAVRYISLIEDLMVQETLPLSFTRNGDFHTPFRTNLIENKTVNYQQGTELFADCNIGFEYEKHKVKDYLTVKTNLKWLGFADPDNKQRVSKYIEELLLLCKNKVLSEGGDLASTDIIWFYPVSMERSRVNKLKGLWKDCYKEIFGASDDMNSQIDNRVTSILESIAPFNYYKNEKAIAFAFEPSVSIDIGGGTSDIVILRDGKPAFVTSFRYAGNAIYGDGFNGSQETNGYIQRYGKKIFDLLEQNNLTNEVEIFELLKDTGASSADMASYFFSFEQNKNIADKKLEKIINFSDFLKDDDDFRLVFLLFFGSIVYHIAQLLKATGTKNPRNLLLSGTASKNYHLMGLDREAIRDYFQYILTAVNGGDDEQNKSTRVLDVIIDDYPKEVTAKGALSKKGVDDVKVAELVRVLLGNGTEGGKMQNPLDNEKETNLCFGDISSNKIIIEEVVQNVEEFYKLFDQIDKKLNFKNLFGISEKSRNIFKKVRSQDLHDFTLQGIHSYKEAEDIADTESLAESLFFYPLTGMLNRLAYTLHTDNK